MTGGPAFAELAGQEAVVGQLRAAAAAAAAAVAARSSGGAGRSRAAASGASGAGTSLAMTHAWLFTGPPGSGRSVAARDFAAALL